MPNLYLTAAYLSDGIWNASHYKNPRFDSAAKSFLGAVDDRAQQAVHEEDGWLSAARHAGR